MDRRILNDLKEHEIPFFHYVRYIFQARYTKSEKYHSEVTADGRRKRYLIAASLSERSYAANTIIVFNNDSFG